MLNMMEKDRRVGSVVEEEDSSTASEGLKQAMVMLLDCLRSGDASSAAKAFKSALRFCEHEKEIKE